MKEKTYMPRILSMDTIEKLKGLLKRVDKEPTDEIINLIELYTEVPMELSTPGSFIINQEALRQLISAFESMSEDDQLFLIQEAFAFVFACKNTPGIFQNTQKLSTYENLRLNRDLAIRAVKTCLLGEEKEPPASFEIIEQNLNGNTKRLFSRMSLKPEGNEAALFAEWMKIVLADPLFVNARQRLENERKQGDALFNNKLPEVKTGKQIHLTYAALRKRKDEPRHEEWKKYPEFLDDYFLRNPKHYLTDGRRACAKKYNKVLETIERRTKGYKKPPTG